MEDAQQEQELKKILEQLERMADFSSKKSDELKKMLQAWADSPKISNYIRQRDIFSQTLMKNVRHAFQKIITRQRAETVVVNQQQQVQQRLLTQDVKELISLLLWCSKQQLLDTNKSIKFVEEIFECFQLKEIREIFDLVEREITQIYDLIKPDINNSILRLCNSIFRKLSRTQDVELRGRLHIFLTKLLPLCHASGQNRKGLLNSNNTTIIESEEVQGVHQKHSYAFYRQFWALQKYFLNPQLIVSVKEDNDLLQVQQSNEEKGDSEQLKKRAVHLSLEKRKLEAICVTVEQVMEIFRSNPIEDSGKTATMRYPKFLSTRELLEIQLQDVVFRKVFCVQCQLFFYNLTSSDKSQLALSEEMLAQIKPAEENVKKTLRGISDLLKEVPLDDQIKVFLEQEREWAKMKAEQWKNNQDTFPPSLVDASIIANVLEAQEIAGCIAIKSQKKFPRGIFGQNLATGGREADKTLRTHIGQIVASESTMCREDSRLRELVHIDAQYRFTVSTEPLQASVGYYFDQVLSEKRNDSSDKLKDTPVGAWKALRTLAHFDDQKLRDSAEHSQTRDLEIIAESLLHEQQQQQASSAKKEKQTQEPAPSKTTENKPATDRRSPPSAKGSKRPLSPGTTRKYETIHKNIKRE